MRIERGITARHGATGIAVTLSVVQKRRELTSPTLNRYR